MEELTAAQGGAVGCDGTETEVNKGSEKQGGGGGYIKDQRRRDEEPPPCSRGPDVANRSDKQEDEGEKVEVGDWLLGLQDAPVRGPNCTIVPFLTDHFHGR